MRRVSRAVGVDGLMRVALSLRLLLVLALCLSMIQIGHSSPQTTTQQGYGLNRSVSLTIKIVLIGLTPNQLNSTYLVSNVTVPLLKYQTILAGPINTGVIYNFNYQIEFADSSTVTRFAQYLTSIQQEQDTNATARPPALVNPYFANSSTLALAKNYFYDADKVESWLGSNIGVFGGSPVDGYTLFVADLSNATLGIPSFSYSQYQGYIQNCRACTVYAHYYNRTITDPDLGLANTRHFMTGWGGSGRFYYMDLSAGPSYWTNELPVQVAASLRGVDLNSYYGRTWVSKFVGSYAAGAVYNLFAADELYPVDYSQSYNVHIFLLDNRTTSEKSQGPSLASTVNRTMIQDALASLVPFAKVTVNVQSSDVTAYPGLAAVVANSTTNLIDPLTKRPIVDGDLVYRWLTRNGLGHISNFINVTRSITTGIDIPAFIFALKENYTFGVPVREDIGSESSQQTFAGEALGDMVLIGLSQSDFTLGNNSTYNQPGKGDGFTHAAIHELGHMMGLNHPFIYDQTEDFTDTVMGYYAYSLSYSQFDRDTILRGVNDELLSFAEQTLSSTSNDLINTADISMAQQNIAQAEQLYNNMNYSSAVPYSFAAANYAYTAQQLAAGIASPALIFSLLGVVIGVVLGVGLGYLVFRRRKTPAGVQYNRCPTCQQPVRWDPVMMRWYCDRCQKPV